MIKKHYKTFLFFDRDYKKQIEIAKKTMKYVKKLENKKPIYYFFFRGKS